MRMSIYILSNRFVFEYYIELVRIGEGIGLLEEFGLWITFLLMYLTTPNKSSLISHHWNASEMLVSGGPGRYVIRMRFQFVQ